MQLACDTNKYRFCFSGRASPVPPLRFGQNAASNFKGRGQGKPFFCEGFKKARQEKRSWQPKWENGEPLKQRRNISYTKANDCRKVVKSGFIRGHDHE